MRSLGLCLIAALACSPASPVWPVAADAQTAALSSDGGAVIAKLTCTTACPDSTMVIYTVAGQRTYRFIALPRRADTVAFSRGPSAFAVQVEFVPLKVTKSVTLTIAAAPAPPPIVAPALPVITLSASPLSIASGQTSTVTWTATNATTCTASDGTQQLAAPLSGSQAYPFATTTTLTLTCSNASGSASKSVTVTVASAPPVEPPPVVTPPSGGGVLYTNTFDEGSLAGLGQWGTPHIVADATANGGRSLQFDWVGGRENDQGVAYDHVPNALRVYVRFRYKQSATADNSGIKKTVRFRGTNDTPLGTFNIQEGNWIFNGDNYSFAPWNIKQTGAGTSQALYTDNAPNAFRGRWRTVEVMLDYSDRAYQRAAMWVDGVQIIAYEQRMTTPLPASLAIQHVYLASVFNTPAQTRSEWFDDVVISTARIGN